MKSLSRRTRGTGRGSRSRRPGEPPVILETLDDIRRGTRALTRRCELMRRVHAITGTPPLRRQQAGFEGLARIVVAQQVSAASASAIWSRTVTHFGCVTPDAIMAAPDETLRACGLSRGKSETLRAISAAISSGQLDLDALAAASDHAIHESLTAVRGIGPWTADIYIMFSLGRSDAWAPGDLALKLAVARASGHEKPLPPAEMERLSETWRPWRAVAARLLWSYYATGRT